MMCAPTFIRSCLQAAAGAVNTIHSMIDTLRPLDPPEDNELSPRRDNEVSPQGDKELSSSRAIAALCKQYYGDSCEESSRVPGAATHLDALSGSTYRDTSGITLPDESGSTQHDAVSGSTHQDHASGSIYHPHYRARPALVVPSMVGGDYSRVSAPTLKGGRTVTVTRKSARGVAIHMSLDIREHPLLW